MAAVPEPAGRAAVRRVSRRRAGRAAGVLASGARAADDVLFGAGGVARGVGARRLSVSAVSVRRVAAGRACASKAWEHSQCAGAGGVWEGLSVFGSGGVCE